MMNVKLFGASLALLSVLASCSSGPPKPNADKADPRYATLLNMPLTDFYGTLAIAVSVGKECPTVKRNSRIDYQLNEARNERGNGSFAALTQRAAIKASQKSMKQAFRSQHSSDLCGVVVQDFEDASKPYTFFLMGAGGE